MQEKKVHPLAGRDGDQLSKEEIRDYIKKNAKVVKLAVDNGKAFKGKDCQQDEDEKKKKQKEAKIQQKEATDRLQLPGRDVATLNGERVNKRMVIKIEDNDSVEDFKAHLDSFRLRPLTNFSERTSKK